MSPNIGNAELHAHEDDDDAGGDVVAGDRDEREHTGPGQRFAGGAQPEHWAHQGLASFRIAGELQGEQRPRAQVDQRVGDHPHREADTQLPHASRPEISGDDGRQDQRQRPRDQLRPEERADVASDDTRSRRLDQRDRAELGIELAVAHVNAGHSRSPGNGRGRGLSLCTLSACRTTRLAHPPTRQLGGRARCIPIEAHASQPPVPVSGEHDATSADHQDVDSGASGSPASISRCDSCVVSSSRRSWREL